MSRSGPDLKLLSFQRAGAASLLQPLSFRRASKASKEESAVRARHIPDYLGLPLTFPAAAADVTLPSELCATLWHVNVHVFVARL